MSTPPGTQAITLSLETRAESARVESAGYESLNAAQTKKAFTELNLVLNSLAHSAIGTLDQMTPYLAKMQSLLSQRGSDRKRVLKAAGLPSWTEWAASFADKFDRSLRTIQDYIQIYRHGTKSKQSSKASKAQKPLKLDSRQQSALVKAQLAANDLVFALKNEGDWRCALAEYDKVAVTPAKLDGFVNALNPEPDWKSALTQLVGTLQQHVENLPASVVDEIRSVEKLLGCAADMTQPDQHIITVENGVTSAEICEPPAVELVDLVDETQPSSPDAHQQICVERSECVQPVNREPATSVKVTKCPPAYKTDEGSCERIVPDARGFKPKPISRAGYEINEDGELEYVGKSA